MRSSGRSVVWFICCPSRGWDTIFDEMRGVKADGLMCVDGESVTECLDFEVRRGLPGDCMQALDDFIFRLSGKQVPRWQRLSDAAVSQVLRSLNLKYRGGYRMGVLEIFGLGKGLPFPPNVRTCAEWPWRVPVLATLFRQGGYPMLSVVCCPWKPKDTPTHLHMSYIHNIEELRRNLVRTEAACQTLGNLSQ